MNGLEFCRHQEDWNGVYEARWGLRVEQRPDLVEYFRRHELPPPSWEGWRPDVSMDHIKIKVAQNLGLDLSDMGYYPQQIQEANLVNPAYPNFEKRTHKDQVIAQIEEMMRSQGIIGSVNARRSAGPTTSMQLNAGVF